MNIDFLIYNNMGKTYLDIYISKISFYILHKQNPSQLYSHIRLQLDWYS